VAPNEPRSNFEALWRELDEVREAMGWSRERLARQIGALDGRPVPAKTLHDRMRRGRRVSWDQLRPVVLALELEETDWRSRWQQAESTRRMFGRATTAETSSGTRPGRGKPDTASSQSRTPPDAARPVVPAQLPADVPAFTGRAAELAELDRLAGTLAAVVISAVSGTAGVGKTALAVRWSHLVSHRFPDGQLYVNLRGYDPGQPVSAGRALTGFLSALGVPEQEIPVDEDQRAARYRTEVAGRRMLVVLDNASSVEQVRPLLPGTPTCTVLVTSRDSLPGLVALHGARRLDLDLLPLGDAVTLLRRLIGDRIDVEPGAAAVLAAQCARLPLALRVAAELATSRPGSTLADLTEELSDQQRRLDLLDAGGDERAAVRAVFSWSYRHLPADSARAFRLLALHPGADFDAYAAAALTDTGLDEAHRLCAVLARAHLTQPTRPGWYGMHDLLRGYGAQLAKDEDGEDGQAAALTRLFDAHLATAAAAADTLYPAERHRRPRVAAATTPTAAVAHPDDALAWLDTHLPTSVDVCAYTAAHGWPAHTTRLAATLFRYLENAGRYAEALAVHTHALTAAVHTADRAGEALARTGLGAIHWRLGRYDEAAEHHRRGLMLFRQVGDRLGEAIALTNLGNIEDHLGRYDQAGASFTEALYRYREARDPVGEAAALTNLGYLDWRLGRYEQAASSHREALERFRELGDRMGEAAALTNLGLVHDRQGDYERAVDYQREVLALCFQLGNRLGEGIASTNLGDLDTRLGRYRSAAEHHRHALDVFRQIRHRFGEAFALNGLGRALQGDGRSADARSHHAAALAVASEIGHAAEQARAHTGLGHTYRTAGDIEQARYHWRNALALLTSLGAPDADAVQEHLTALDGPDEGDDPETEQAVDWSGGPAGMDG
jgi:tetratricopeptide (TPR) repeat protein